MTACLQGLSHPLEYYQSNTERFTNAAKHDYLICHSVDGFFQLFFMKASMGFVNNLGS